MSTFKTVGIILRRTNYSEADRIITFLTPNHGKVEAIAKGVRRPTAKLASHLELFGVIELMLAKGRNLDVITSARIGQSWPKISDDYERLRRAFLFCEMINKLTGHDTSKLLYQLLSGSLAALNAGIEPVFAELYFKLHLLNELGYKPDLEKVSEAKGSIYLHVEAGGVSEQTGEKVSRDEIKLMRLLYDFPLNKVARVKGIATPAQRLLGIIDRFYDHHFNQRFKSAEI